MTTGTDPTPAAATTTTPAADRRMGRVTRAALMFLTAPELVTFVLLLIAVAVGASLSPYFLDADYLLNSTSLYMETGLMALAMTFVIVSGNIDLSVASNLALTACLVATLHERGVPMAVAAPLGPVIGALLGLFNGLLITRLRLPSLTVTLGTLALYRGLAQVLAGDRSIGGFPPRFVGINYRYLGPVEAGDYVLLPAIPMPLILFLAFALAFGFVLRKTLFGRYVFAIGTNEAAARFSGIRVDRMKLAVFTISGAMAGLAAVVAISRLSVARYNIATGGDSELAVITAVVLGGTDIAGGRGGVLGTVIALFLLGIMRNGMEAANKSSETQLAVTGALLVISVLLGRASAAARAWAMRLERRKNE